MVESTLCQADSCQLGTVEDIGIYMYVNILSLFLDYLKCSFKLDLC